VNHPRIDGKDGVAGWIPAALRTETARGLTPFDGVEHARIAVNPSGRYPSGAACLSLGLYISDTDKF
jgi:hypothetical protein